MTGGGLFDVDDDLLTDEQLREKYAPVHLGMTWERDADGRWVLPERTLGWGCAAWCADYLHSVARDANEGDPFVFTLEQLRFLLWWYAVDERGKFIYRTGVLQRVKGWGKDPLVAVLSLLELCGPVRFAGWDDDGRPVGIEQNSPWVAVAAVSQDQTINTMSMFPSLISPRLQADYQVDVKKKLVYSRGGKGRIVAVTSSPESLQGNRSTLCILNEALDVDTPIRVGGGFKRMGDLVVGDEVFAPDGSLVRVNVADPVQVGRDCFNVSVDTGNGSGAGVVASDGHLWFARRDGTDGRVWSTGEMFNTGGSFEIPRPAPLEGVEFVEGADPYLMGVWFGCKLAFYDPDLQVEFSKRDLSGGVEDLIATSVSVGSDHQVPEKYLHASIGQRLELLRGFMDSAGMPGPHNQALFFGQEHTCQTVASLAASLGFLPCVRFVAGRHCWQVVFAVEGFNPFAVSYKANQVKVFPRPEWVRIRIEPVESRPVRCIGVDSEDHLFVAGDGLVTHNTQHWYQSNGGVAMKNTLDGNAAKMSGRYIAITNAPDTGKDSVAYQTRINYEKSLSAGHDVPGLLYDSLEAPGYTPLTERAFKAAFEQVRGDAKWLSAEETWKSVVDPSRPVAESRRMYLNQLWAPDSALYRPDEWDRLAIPGETFKPGDRIVLGFDGGRTDDATALVGLRVADCLLVPLLCLERPDGPAGQGWEVDRVRVEAAVSEAFGEYDVAGFFADVNLWESHILQWGRTWGSQLRARSSERDPIGFDMRSLRRSVNAHEEFMSAVLAGKVKHNGDVTLRRHVLNCYRNDTRWGVTFQKESRESKRKVDLYAASMLAYAAWKSLVSAEAGRAKRTSKQAGRVWFGGQGRRRGNY